MTRKKIEIPPFNIADYRGWRTDEGLAHWLNNKVVPSIEQYLSPREITDEEIREASDAHKQSEIESECFADPAWSFEAGARWCLERLKNGK